MGVITEKTIINFWKKVDKVGSEFYGCWDWTARVNHSGYGVFHLNRMSILAHRFSWMIHKGGVKEGYSIHHGCGNRRCVNPDHLVEISHSEHMMERTIKLNKNDVIEIKKLIVNGFTLKYIAGCYGVTPEMIGYIKRGQQWRHV